MREHRCHARRSMAGGAARRVVTGAFSLIATPNTGSNQRLIIRRYSQPHFDAVVNKSG
jgi:hypothetical protein